MDRFEKYRKSDKGKASLKRRTERYFTTSKGKQTRARWVEKNREKINKWGKDRRIKSPESVMLTTAKSRAKKKGIEFSIDISDIFIPEFCPVLGLKLMHGNGRWSNECPSLDRIIPEKGYVKGNVKVISYRANMLKNNGTIKEFECIIDYLKKELPNN